MRAEPDAASEQVSEALPGEPLTVAEQRNGWARVETAYDYSGWVEASALGGDPDACWLQPTASDPVVRVELERVIEEERERLKRYQSRFRHSSAAGIGSKAVLLVDDGLATGATTEAAVRSAWKHGARSVIVAAPVGSTHAIQRIERVADAVEVMWVDPEFEAVGRYYESFPQTTDEEVIGCLERAAASAPRPPAATAAADDPPALSEEVEPGAGQVRLAGYLAHPRLGAVTAPTLLIVGGHDDVVLDLNRRAQAGLRCENQLAVVPGATHLFEEPGPLAAAALARDWFVSHLATTAIR